MISELPTIILKDKNEDDVYSTIPEISKESVDTLSRILTIYS